MYINDICNVSKLLRFVLFADDTNILVSRENLQQLLSTTTSEISKLKKWFDRNKLSLNLNKTKIMIFGKCKKSEHIQVQIEGVERVYENKFLGVITDDRICWKPHIKHIQTKLSRSISVLSKVKHFLNNKSLHILYNPLILPYLNYCSEIWGNTYKSSLQPLCILQKRDIRIIHNVDYCEHTNQLFIQSKTLKFLDLVEFKTAHTMFKARNNMLPKNIQEMFFEREGSYKLRGQLNLKVRRARTTKKSFYISIYGVKLWNRLSVEVQKSQSIRQFKNKYKDIIFARYRNLDEPR